MNFDALKPYSEAEYLAFIGSLSDSVVERLRTARSVDEWRLAVLAYIENAYAAHLCAEEIVDYFCVSDGCVTDRLSLPESEADRLVSLFDQVHDDVIAKRRA